MAVNSGAESVGAVMLRELAVRDLALIERARVAFGPGLTVITGETGAGKSLLIDALGLVMGERADSGLVRHGAPGARVEALFERDDGDGVVDPLICVRELSAEGRSVARIDDETVTAARLAAVVDPLVEIHGQHEQARLLATPASPDRACDVQPPSGRRKTPFSMTNSFLAANPSSS